MNLDEIIKKHVSDDLILEFAKIDHKHHGIENVVVYASASQGAHGPRVKIGPKPDDLRFSVTISDNPKVVAGKVYVDQKILQQTFDWIKLNKVNLLDYWNEKIQITGDFWTLSKNYKQETPRFHSQVFRLFSFLLLAAHSGEQCFLYPLSNLKNLTSPPHWMHPGNESSLFTKQNRCSDKSSLSTKVVLFSTCSTKRGKN